MKPLLLGLILCMTCAFAATTLSFQYGGIYEGPTPVCGDGVQEITEICETEIDCTKNRVCDPASCQCLYTQPCSEGYQCLNLTDAQALRVCTWTPIVCDGSPLPDTNLKYCYKCTYTSCEKGECLLPQQASDRGLGARSRAEPCNMENGNPYYCYEIGRETYIPCIPPLECLQSQEARDRGCVLSVTGLCSPESFCYTCQKTETEIPPVKAPETFTECPLGCSCLTEQEAQRREVAACGGRVVPCKPEEGVPRFCYSNPVESSCGNGYCEFDEDRASCCQDCGCSQGLTCIDGACATPQPLCPDDAACMPREDCINNGCSVKEGSQCRKPLNTPNSMTAPSQTIIPGVVCCSCPSKPMPTECERKGGLCIPREDECPRGFRSAGTQQCAPRSNQCCVLEEQPPTCQSVCSKTCCETPGATTCPVFNTTCFRTCMQDCAPSIQVACNFNGACETGESWKFCCTDCTGCESQQFVCERLTGECVPPGGPTAAQVDQLTAAINRVADLLQSLINLLSRK